MSAEESIAIINEFNKFTGNILNQMAACEKEVQKYIEDIVREGEETIKNLESTFSNLKLYSGQTQNATNFKNFKEQLEKINKERQDALDAALKLKGEQRAEIASINKEMEQVNEDIKQLTEDNERITEILKTETDNLVCRLMKGANH